MRRFLVVAAVAFGGAAEAQTEDEKKKRITDLVARLGDPSFAAREEAGKELLAIGEPALPAVRRAAAVNDVPEAAQRAERLVRAIMKAAGVSKTAKLELVVIEGGEFDMGSPDRELGRRADEKQHKAAVTAPFLIGRTEVTQAEYKAATDKTPSWFTPDGGGKAKVPDKDTGRYAVETVSWFDAVAFCNRLSKLDGYPEYYTLSDAKTDGDGIVGGTVKVVGGSGYRLPTEAEWELACRAGTKTAFFFGAYAQGGEGNFKFSRSIGYGGTEEKPSLGRTTKVGTYKPNRNDLHDLAGNAAEWVHDWYDKGYPDPSPDDHPGPAKGDHRVVRGGSWMNTDAGCRSAARFFLAPGERKDYVGFRVARTP